MHEARRSCAREARRESALSGPDSVAAVSELLDPPLPGPASDEADPVVPDEPDAAGPDAREPDRTCPPAEARSAPATACSSPTPRAAATR